jgi:hypothetical protein
MRVTRSTAAAAALPSGRDPRIAFLGPEAWLGCCAPPTRGQPRRLALPLSGDRPSLAAEPSARLEHFAPAVSVVFAPDRFAPDFLRALPGVTLGVLTDASGAELGPQVAAAAAALDRLVSFRPELSGARVDGARIWRMIPPPVGDGWFSEVRPLHGRPSAMTLGRSTPHREVLLLPAKHHHDLLQVIHGVEGELLRELLAEHDVAVYVPPRDGGFGPQAALHLAAGQLLFAQGLAPLHGLEPGLDYVPFTSGQDLVHRLDRLARFPEMHQRVRIRGRMKAESFRASTLFGRVVEDLHRDVAVFGSARR